MAKKLQNILKTGKEKGRIYYWKLSTGNEVMLTGGGNSGYWQVWVRDKVGGSTAVSSVYAYNKQVAKDMEGFHTVLLVKNEKEAYDMVREFAEKLIQRGMI